MEGVTTALVGFIFVCVVYPHLVKNRPQYYAALAFICIIILLDGLAKMLSVSPAFGVLLYAVSAFLQVCSILLLFLAAGGITWQQLAGDMSNAFEVIRRGGEKETIIPLTGAKPKPRAERATERAAVQSERIVINDPMPPKSPSSVEKIPLE